MSTDDAQVDGHIYPVTSRISGTVTWVNPSIDDTKFVEAGTVLAHLDSNDYSPAVERLQGDVQAEQAQLAGARLAVPITEAQSSSKLAGAQAAVLEAGADLVSAQAGEAAAQAQIAQVQASYKRAEDDRLRYQHLIDTHEISRSEFDARTTEANVAAAQLVAAEANFSAAQDKVEAAQQKLEQRRKDVDAAAVVPQMVATARSRIQGVSGDLKKSTASLHDAELNLSYTEVVAPVSGIVGRRSLELGQRVAVGQLLLDLVPTEGLWVTANFKETQLRHVTLGAPVDIRVDTYGGSIHGSVESIGGATGAKYSLIAPENATGNYVKVVQRIPVRIRLDRADVSGRSLLPGMSVEAHLR